MFQHEEASLSFIDQLYQSDDIKAAFEKWGLTDEHVTLIKNLVLVPKKMNPDIAKNYYLYQVGVFLNYYKTIKFFPPAVLKIVSNNDYDVDVDKWDYILRDQKQLNISNSFNPQRLLNYCQVLPVRRGQEKYDRLEICFRSVFIFFLYA